MNFNSYYLTSLLLTSIFPIRESVEIKDFFGKWRKIEMYGISELLETWDLNWFIRQVANFLSPRVVLSENENW